MKLGFPLQLWLLLAVVERFGVHRLHEVVNQEQEQAPKCHQAHRGQEDAAADKEGVHDLQRNGKKSHFSFRMLQKSGEHTTSWKKRTVPEDCPGRKIFGVPPDFSLGF